MRKPVLYLCAALCLPGGTAFADTTNWGTSGDWSIEIDEVAASACLMQRTLDSGHVVELGYLPERKGGFLAVYHPDWTDVTEGQEAFWEFRFDDSRFGGQAVAVFRGDLAGGAAYFDNPEFVDDMAKRNNVTLVPPNADPIEISLKGTLKAVEQVKACQQEQPW